MSQDKETCLSPTLLRPLLSLKQILAGMLVSLLHVSAGIAIGGDSYPGSTLSDHCLRYENIPQIKIIVVLGELGGTDEYSLVDALKAGKIKKPVVAWVSGTCAKLFKSEVQFGHAGAKSGGQAESAQVSNWHPIIPCSRSLCMLRCHDARNPGDHSLFCLRPFHMLARVFRSKDKVVGYPTETSLSFFGFLALVSYQ